MYERLRSMAGQGAARQTVAREGTWDSCKMFRVDGTTQYEALLNVRCDE